MTTRMSPFVVPSEASRSLALVRAAIAEHRRHGPRSIHVPPPPDFAGPPTVGRRSRRGDYDACQMNPSVAGKSYPDATFTVDPARVGAFNTVFDDASGVPVTFVTAAEFTVLPTIVGDPELDLDFTRVLHGGQEYTFARALRSGETLTVRTRIDSIRV